MAAVLAVLLLSLRPLGFCLVGWNCTGHLLMRRLQILPLGVSVSLPSAQQNVISVCHLKKLEALKVFSVHSSLFSLLLAFLLPFSHSPQVF